MAEHQFIHNSQVLKAMWRAAGGRFYGPNVETGAMPASMLIPLLAVLTRHYPPVELENVVQAVIENRQEYIKKTAEQFYLATGPMIPHSFSDLAEADRKHFLARAEAWVDRNA